MPKLITDWNDVNVGGWFWSDIGAANAPDPTIECFGTAYNKGNPEVFVQEVWGLVNVNEYYHWLRLVYPGTGNGTPWEWPNPPMLLGVEYRTTERYLGKPVYVKAVSGGAITADSKKAVSMSDVGESIVDACVVAKLSNGTAVRLPYTDSFGGTSGEVFSSVQSGVVYVAFTLHGINATESTAIAKYTKATD